jgi:serine/threonine-protein kinase
METLVQVMEREPEPPRRADPTIPRDLEHICLKALEKDVSRRYASCSALADDLDRFLLGEHISKSHTKSLEEFARRARREPELSARIIGIFILGTAVQVSYFLAGRPQTSQHLKVTAILLAWLTTALVFEITMRRERLRESIKLAWVTLEIVFISWILWIRQDPTGSTVIVYPLLIAAAGLWSRVKLVWQATIISISAYLILMVGSYYSENSPSLVALAGVPKKIAIVVGTLIITGFVVVQHVKRILAISSYYEHRKIT